MIGRGSATAAPQDHLPGHEFAVVLAQTAIQRLEAGVGAIGTAGPFPNVPKQLAGLIGRVSPTDHRREMVLLDKVACTRKTGSGHFPFGFGWQAGAGPAGVCVRLVKAQVTDGCLFIDRL